jgi:ArsR family transcriptional regulator, arsenate/arsenite/antimonite-responsive transcriptional repressor
MQTALDTAKALADGNRMRVVVALLDHDELCVCQITELLRITMATVSRHMSILHKARLVQSRKEGRWVYYRLGGSFPSQVNSWLREAVRDTVEIKADRQKLAEILACNTADICRRYNRAKSAKDHNTSESR